MPAQNPAHRIIDDGQTIVDSSKRIINDVQQLYDSVRSQNSLREVYQQNPYVMLAAAAGVGYLVAGGLFTPFSRRIVRIGLKGLIIPIAAAQLKNLSTAGLEQPSFLAENS